MDLRPGLRLAGTVAALLPVLMSPVGDATVLMMLFVALDIGVVALVLRHVRPARIELPANTVFPPGVEESLLLLRRTLPELRMRRPGAVIEEQVRWRQVAEAHRRARESF
jgi:hypothetical protein